jgi:hypothetical protein
MSLTYAAYSADASVIDKIAAYKISIASGASMATTGGSLDLTSLPYSSQMTVGFSGTSSKGTLTVSNGAQTAGVALLGNYLSSTFTAGSDGHGGTMITDAAKTSHATPILAARI